MKGRTTGTVLVVALGAAAALVLVFCRGVAVESVYPFERVAQHFSRKVLTRVRGFFRGAEAQAENVALRREVASLVMVRAENEALEAENARLRSALQARARFRGEWIAAGVLSRDGGAGGARRTIRVDRGSKDGIVEGAVVAVPEGLVGRVRGVTPHTAEIALITDSSVKVAVQAEGTQLRGILVGGDDGVLLLRHLNRGVAVAARARIITSGLGGVFPAGIAVGTLLELRNNAEGSPSVGEVEPAVDYPTLEDVFIRCER